MAPKPGPVFPHLQADDVLPVDLTDVMIGEEAVSGSRTVLHYGSDFSTFKNKANMPTAVLMHSDCPLKGPVSIRVGID